MNGKQRSLETKTSRLLGLFVAASLIATGCSSGADKDCARGEDCERSSGGGPGSWGRMDKPKKDVKGGRGGIGGRSGSSGGG